MEVIQELCRADPQVIHRKITTDTWWMLGSVATILIGSGLYGFTIGIWRAPLQGIYVAIKFPMIILCIAFTNALINGMLGQLLGLSLSFRESTRAILTSFALFSIIVGSLVPATLFIYANLPVPESEFGLVGNGALKLIHILIIATAGTISNLRLYRYLIFASGGRHQAIKILISWLAINLFLGSQLYWNARPFMGDPRLPVEFFRDEAFKGNFFENASHTIYDLFKHTTKGDAHD